MKKYKVAYATGSRADYGIVKNYLKLLNEDDEIEFTVLVTGSHLEEKFGSSVNIIKSDGFTIEKEINLNISNSSNSGVISAMSRALEQFGVFFQQTKYDLLIILGDRYEMFSVATAAAMNRIPILHLHGGEITYGNYDEFIRHSITKMSTYHFAATEVYRNRIIQMGEEPERVFNLGALGAENCKKIDESVVSGEVKKLENKNYYVVVFHPETLTDADLTEQINEVLAAVKCFKDTYFVFMGTNADTNSDEIRNRWLDYTNENRNIIYIENLNVDSFLYMLRNAIALVGNSSSGIIEAPSLGTYTINIGLRQSGRERGSSVIDVNCKREEIVEAMTKCREVSAPENKFINPYYKENTKENYYNKTKEILHKEITGAKKFYDYSK